MRLSPTAWHSYGFRRRRLFHRIPRLTGRYTGFLAHELFHLWNRSGDANMADWWLPEGRAEYASWVAVSTLWPGEASLDARVDGALRNCAMYLGANALSALDAPDQRAARYPCGAALQWMADVGLRSKGVKRDVFWEWKRLLAMRKAQGWYGPADFDSVITELAPEAASPMRALIDGQGIERWAAIAGRLNAMGAQVEVGEPTPFLMLLTAAQALVRSACGEVYGVGEDQRGLFVQAPEDCAAFGGDSSLIASLEGVAPMVAPRPFHDVALARCASSSQVAVVAGFEATRRTVSFKCSVPVEPPPPTLKVIRAVPSP